MSVAIKGKCVEYVYVSPVMRITSSLGFIRCLARRMIDPLNKTAAQIQIGHENAVPVVAQPARGQNPTKLLCIFDLIRGARRTVPHPGLLRRSIPLLQARIDPLYFAALFGPPFRVVGGGARLVVGRARVELRDIERGQLFGRRGCIRFAGRWRGAEKARSEPPPSASSRVGMWAASSDSGVLASAEPTSTVALADASPAAGADVAPSSTAGSAFACANVRAVPPNGSAIRHDRTMQRIFRPCGARPAIVARRDDVLVLLVLSMVSFPLVSISPPASRDLRANGARVLPIPVCRN